MVLEKPALFPLHIAGAPSVGEKIMKIYARMPKEKRELLLRAALAIHSTSAAYFAEDTMPLGEMMTKISDFDPER
jgi:hypothetical protein